jgi:hypothetical protein
MINTIGRMHINRKPAYHRRNSCDHATCPPLQSISVLCDPKSVRSVSQTGQIGFGLSATWSLQLNFLAQPSNQWFSGEPLETLRTRCSHCQSPLMTRLPRSSGSTLVLRLNQETVHDFVLPFLPPCGPHLNPVATGPLEPSLLVFSTPGGLTGHDLSRLFLTCTNTSQAATCTYNT